jgi:hypothetical protein
MEYGAIDLHTKESEIRIIDEAGAVVFERRIATTRTRLTEVFGRRAPLRILLESGTGSDWVAPDQDRSAGRGGAGRGESSRDLSRRASRLGAATRCPPTVARARSVGARAAAGDQSDAGAAAERRRAGADRRGRDLCGAV